MVLQTKLAQARRSESVRWRTGRLCYGCQLRCEIDCCDHAIGARDAFAGDLERGAVIGAGARKRETKRYVHTAVKRVDLQRYQTLIVIHAENSIELAFGGAMENCIGRNWTDNSRFSILDFRL